MQPRIITCRYWRRRGATRRIAAAEHWRPSMSFNRRAAFSSIYALALWPALIAAAFAGPVDMAPVNAMDRAAFVEKFGGIFEKSPWVAEQVWDKRPFSSVDAMHAAMVEVAKFA